MNQTDLYELQLKFNLLIKLLKIDQEKFENEYQKLLVNEIGAPSLENGRMKGFIKRTYYGVTNG